jgi:hypothetical protein
MFASIRVNLAVAALAVLMLTTSQARADFLVFSDNFEGNDFDEKWTHSTEDLAVVNGRVEATANGRFMQTIQSFAGNLRVEYDFGKEGTQNHSCWDNFVHFTSLSSVNGVILFDQDGIDGAGLDTDSSDGICLSQTNFASTSAAGINSGHAVFTYVDSKISFTFTNNDGVVLDAGTVDVGDFDETQLYLNVAAFADSPRWVDNVMVYSSVPEPSTITLWLLACVAGVGVGWWRKSRG